jgi:hypothetical protein
MAYIGGVGVAPVSTRRQNSLSSLARDNWMANAFGDEVRAPQSLIAALLKQSANEEPERSRSPASLEARF